MAKKNAIKRYAGEALARARCGCKNSSFAQEIMATIGAGAAIGGLNFVATMIEDRISQQEAKATMAPATSDFLKKIVRPGMAGVTALIFYKYRSKIEEFVGPEFTSVVGGAKIGAELFAAHGILRSVPGLRNVVSWVGLAGESDEQAAVRDLVAMIREDAEREAAASAQPAQSNVRQFPARMSGAPAADWAAGLSGGDAEGRLKDWNPGLAA